MRTIATRHEGRKEVRYTAPLFGTACPPAFWGGRYRPSHHAAPGTREGGLKLANHSEMSQIDECGCGRPKPKTMLHPPSEAVT